MEEGVLRRWRMQGARWGSLSIHPGPRRRLEGQRGVCFRRCSANYCRRELARSAASRHGQSLIDLRPIHTTVNVACSLPRCVERHSVQCRSNSARAILNAAGEAGFHLMGAFNWNRCPRTGFIHGGAAYEPDVAAPWPRRCANPYFAVRSRRR